MCLPFALLVLANVALLFKEKFQNRRIVFPQFWTLIMQFTLLISSLYTLLAAGSVVPFICKKLSNETYVSIFSSSVKCFEGDWNSAAFFIYSFIIFYGALFPGCLAVVFWKNRRDPENYQFVRVFGHLTRPYKTEQFYWELVAFIKRFSFAVISQITPMYDRTDMTPYFLLTSILFLFNWLEHVFTPYKRHSSSVKSFLWNSIALIMLLCDGFVFKNTSTTSSQKDLFAGFMVAMISIAVVFTVITSFIEAQKVVSANNQKANVKAAEGPNRLTELPAV
jgi:hypothetical protein